MSLLRYPEYRESGIAWADELPSHWGKASLKWLCNRYSGGTPDKNRVDFWENGTIPWLNSGAVNDGRIYEPSAYITQEAFERSSAKWIPAGSLLVALAGQGKTKGMVAQLMFESTCNQSMAAIVSGGEINSRFLYWWLACNYQNIRNMAGGDLRDGLNLELLGEITCPLPLDAEQASIADFLDRETAKIDALIAEQERLLALLAEKRHAIISHAVTRGLNADAPLKDSGIPWLGHVPEHWQVSMLRRFVDGFEQGWSPECDSRPVEDGEWGVLKAGCVNGGTFAADESKALPSTLAPRPELEVRSGDVLMSRASGSPKLIGSVAYVRNPPPRLMLSDKIFRIRLADGVVPEFFALQMGAAPLRNQIEQAIGGAEGLANNLPQARIKEFWLVMPSKSEQQAIVDFLHAEMASLRRLVDTGERGIELLKERRSALVAAAVTGQIDVRGMVEAQAA
ncbi:MAG: restriction endonuclease subunit S [Lysobacteraceae bacterium]